MFANMSITNKIGECDPPNINEYNATKNEQKFGANKNP